MAEDVVYEFVRGDDFVIPMTLTDPDNNETAVPITGWTIESQVRYVRKLISTLKKTGLSSNTLYEVEIRRVGTSMELFVDGVSEDTYTGAYTFNDTGLTNAVYLGEYNNGVELTGDTTHVSLEFL